MVRFQDCYYLFYTIKYNYTQLGALEKIGIGIAQSYDLEEWEDAGGLPLEYAYEKIGAGAPGAIVLEGCVHLFYQTYGNGAKDALCHAVSEDGLHFTKDKANPIYRPDTSWCCGRAIDADVSVFKGKLFLYYATRDHAMRVQMADGAYAGLGSDFSNHRKSTRTASKPRPTLPVPAVRSIPANSVLNVAKSGHFSGVISVAGSRRIRVSHLNSVLNAATGLTTRM